MDNGLVPGPGPSWALVSVPLTDKGASDLTCDWACDLACDCLRKPDSDPKSRDWSGDVPTVTCWERFLLRRSVCNTGSEEDSTAPAAQPALAHPDPAQPDPSQSDPAPPAPANSQSVIPASLGINNTNVQEGRVYASDIHYFFEVTPNKKICKICQLVSLSMMPFQSIGPC